ncbi:hypothetical protein D7V86_07300 [bacterium D16-51]|nr:hypothetical protein D7V96_10325 [bacterium D16-59]RKI60884.1 hypothetical protein D7V86_07300 [bacterium D16-51]
MFPVEEIIARKIADRCCRRELKHLPQITDIVGTCCNDLQIQIPEVIYCETLTRNLNAFYLRKKPYLIYDCCLLEALYIYDSIIFAGKDEHDMEKLFYKLIGEELILNNDLARSLYFSGKYRQLNYSFEDEVNECHKVRQMISLQSYFLIGHELGHLSIAAYHATGIPEDYYKFVNACMAVLTDRVIKDYSFEEFAKMRYGYFMDVCPANMEEYWNGVKNSKKYQHLVEECYCDFQGLKLLLEHYEAPEESIRAISAALNYLILQEAIRSDIKENKLFFGDETHDASRSMYFSVLRMEILLLTLQINKLSNIEEGFREIQSRSMLTKYWSHLIKKIPLEESFSLVSEDDLPKLDKKKIKDILINNFYYVHIE